MHLIQSFSSQLHSYVNKLEREYKKKKKRKQVVRKWNRRQRPLRPDSWPTCRLLTTNCWSEGGRMTSQFLSIYIYTGSLMDYTEIFWVQDTHHEIPGKYFWWTLLQHIRNIIYSWHGALIKDGCDSGGFLDHLYSLSYADDTLMLATRREKRIYRINVLFDYCINNSLSINLK